MAHGNERGQYHPDILPGRREIPVGIVSGVGLQMATSYLETNTGNKKPEDVYLGTEPAAQDPEEFAEAEPI